MRRLTSLLLSIAVLLVLAQTQTVRTSYGQQLDSPRMTALPAAVIPVESETLRRSHGGGVLANPDSLTHAQVLQRIGRIYDYQSRLLTASSNDDFAQVEELLDRSMTELQRLLVYPEVVERERFRELYRTVVAEYERYYQVPADTLSLPFGDIFTFHSAMFEVLNNLDDPLLEDVTFPSLGPVATTIPMTENRLVQQSISYLTKSPEKHLYLWMGRAETYFPMIERILEEEGLPDELKYLAMIESGLNPRARSWAAANGMWQFIAATGRAYDLRINSWVDERMDPEKATRAAARHLKDLHKQFGGDWQLALAGYNCSPSRIRRAMRRAEARHGRKATFWDIYNDIPRETRNYVPMFIAASLVVSNPDEFGVDVSKVKEGPEYAYHYVPVRGFLSLTEIADMANTDEAMIRALNPELRRSQVPPSNDGYHIRIPLGTYDQFERAYAELPAAKRQSTDSYVVRRGDTLGKIARQYGVTVATLMRTNNLRSTTIGIGQQIVVPVPSYDSSPLLADLSESDVLTVDYGPSTIRPILLPEGRRNAGRSSISRNATPVRTASTRSTDAAAAGSSTKPDEPATQNEVEEKLAEEKEVKEEAESEATTRIVYTVRRGDNLTDIGKKYGVTVSEIRSWNNLRGSRIQVGQRLHLFETNPEQPAESTTTVYRVRRGDSLGKIAKNHGVSIAELRRWNNLSTTVIRVGQRLSIHERGTQSGPITYQVRRGDSLSVIARKHGVTISDLKRWNSLRSNRIRIGQKLTINS